MLDRVLTAIDKVASTDVQASVPRQYRAVLSCIVEALGALDAALVVREEGRWRIASRHAATDMDDTRIIALCAADYAGSDQGAGIAIPLAFGPEEIGALWLCWPENALPANRPGRDALHALAQATSVVLRNGRLLDELLHRQEEQLRLRAVLEQYVWPSVVDQVLDSAQRGNLRPAGLTVTALMADLRGSTQLTLQFGPELTMELMNDYLDLVTDILFRQHATIDRIEGDGIVALFGAPHSQPDAAARAMIAGESIVRGVRALLSDWQTRAPLPTVVGVGIGIATGRVVVGNIGSVKRLHYTAIGPAINLAARLAGKAPAGTVQMDGPTWHAAARQHGAAGGFARSPSRRYLRAKGFAGRVPVYCLTA